jgi:hypothetical protein
MSLLLLFRPHAGDGGPPIIPVEEGQTPAGRKKPGRKYIVEIDGREFVVDSLAEAMSLLGKAEAIALKHAEREAELKVQASLPKALRLGKADPVQISAPEMKGSPELSAELKRAQDRIRKTYRDAALAAELRILMALDQERDDEDTILLLM